MKDFPWGKVLKTHKIEGLPDIIEYEVSPDYADSGNIEFHVCGCSADTLDEAIVLALSDKYGDLSDASYVWRIWK